MDEPFQIPIYLYTLFYSMFSSVIPIIGMLLIVMLVAKVGKKTIRSFKD